MTPHVSPPADPAPAEEYPPPVCPILTLAGETFERDLPELLQHHSGQWTAYHGAKRLGIVKTSTDAFRLVQTHGIHPYEVAIWRIEADPEMDFIGME